MQFKQRTMEGAPKPFASPQLGYRLTRHELFGKKLSVDNENHDVKEDVKILRGEIQASQLKMGTIFNLVAEKTRGLASQAEIVALKDDLEQDRCMRKADTATLSISFEEVVRKCDRWSNDVQSLRETMLAEQAKTMATVAETMVGYGAESEDLRKSLEEVRERCELLPIHKSLLVEQAREIQDLRKTTTVEQARLASVCRNLCASVEVIRERLDESHLITEAKLTEIKNMLDGKDLEIKYRDLSKSIEEMKGRLDGQFGAECDGLRRSIAEIRQRLVGQITEAQGLHNNSSTRIDQISEQLGVLREGLSVIARQAETRQGNGSAQENSSPQISRRGYSPEASFFQAASGDICYEMPQDIQTKLSDLQIILVATRAEMQLSLQAERSAREQERTLLLERVSSQIEMAFDHHKRWTVASSPGRQAIAAYRAGL